MSPPESEQARWFSEEVQPHESSLRSYLRNVFPSLTDIDDLVQESYARLIRAKDAGRISYAKAFLFATARNARSISCAGAEPPKLAAGWRALVPNRADASVVVEQLPTAQARAILSWQAPSLFFVETPLADVIEQFNRRNHVQLSLADSDLANLPVGGRFGAGNVEAFVRLLTSNGDIVVERPAADRIVLRRAHN